MEKLLLPIAILLLNSLHCDAQRYLKVFGGFGVQTIHTTKNITQDNIVEEYNYKRIGISKPTFVYTKYADSGKRFQEFQVGKFSLERVNDETISKPNGGVSVIINGDLDYHVAGSFAFSENFYLGKEKPEKSAFWIGAGIEFQTSYKNHKPATSISFPKIKIENSLTLWLITRYTYKISDKFLFDVHLPITLNRLDANYCQEQNPVVSVFQQREFIVDDHWKPFFNEIRFGLGMFF